MTYHDDHTESATGWAGLPGGAQFIVYLVIFTAMFITALYVYDWAQGMNQVRESVITCREYRLDTVCTVK